MSRFRRGSARVGGYAKWLDLLRLNRLPRVLVAVLGVGLLCDAAPAQEPVDTALSEWARLRQDLRPIEQQAIRDPIVRELRDRMEVQLRSAIANDREYRDRQELYLSIEVRALAARQRGDQAELDRIVASRPQVERDFWAAHSRIEKLPDVAPAVVAYRQGLKAKMLELNATREADISRMFTLWEEEDHPSRVNRPVVP